MQITASKYQSIRNLKRILTIETPVQAPIILATALFKKLLKKLALVHLEYQKTRTP